MGAGWEEILMRDWAGNGAVVGVRHHVGKPELDPGVSDWVPLAASGEFMSTSKIRRGGLHIGLRVGGRRVHSTGNSYKTNWAGN